MLSVEKKSKLLFGLLMSGSMALFMSGIMTYLNNGIVSDFISIWANAFMIAYPIVYILSMSLSPAIAKITSKLVR
ncbi:MAG: DUF2798 domain-containing protein [Proteobacteria bacterium]|nr:DUF2798 domain-containing protein [Pseudomonadota bacterium]